MQFYLLHTVMLITFVALLFPMAGLMLWPVKSEHDEMPEYLLPTAIIGCVIASFLVGMVGIGGGTIAGFFGLVGWLSDISAVPWALRIPLVAGILPGSLLGIYANRMMLISIAKGFAVPMLVLAVQQLIEK
ncbi:MAG: hypothetical protein ACUVQ6_06120 [Dissulfurimicrobium sp.]